MKLHLSDENSHLYLKIYHYYKDLILAGELGEGTKLPSIRRASMEFEMSKTTVESAYLLLAAEGYIVAKPQSGYFVTDIGKKVETKKEETITEQKKSIIRYDFSSASVDKESFPFDLWRRYVKSALRQDDRLLSYGEPQGEWELREALANYLSKGRNVIVTADSIVVGAGVQSLIHILCPMLKERKMTYFLNREFHHGHRIFADHGYRLQPVMDEAELEGLLDHSIFYLTPSQMSGIGEVMTAKERMRLLEVAKRKKLLLIEDDYNSEFRYYNRPVPSIQGLAGGQDVVYIGSFSRLLLPSIRISFMVLPPDLLKEYKKRKTYYNQTASKAEQIALCQFIRDGHMDSQIRKSRKLYSAKAKQLEEEIENTFGDLVRLRQADAGFSVLVELTTTLTLEQVAEKSRHAGILLRPLSEEAGKVRFLLSCSAVSAEEYPAAIRLMYQTLTENS